LVRETKQKKKKDWGRKRKKETKKETEKNLETIYERQKDDFDVSKLLRIRYSQ